MMLLRATGYSGANDPNSAESTPAYDKWGPDEHWSAADWQTWHGAMVAKYGKDTADKTFLQAYANAGVLEEITRARVEDENFIAWAKDAGLYDGMVEAETGIRGYEHFLYESGVARYAPVVGIALGALLLYRILKK